MTMASAQVIQRHSLFWLFIGQSFVIAPFVSVVPLWMIAVALFCMLWRLQIYQGRWNYPSRLVKTAIIIAVSLAIYRDMSASFSLESNVTLLLAAFVLKLLEMKQKKDCFLLIMLAYFIITTYFLFAQDFLTTLYILAVLVLITACMISIQQYSGGQRRFASIKTSAALIMQSIPLMLVLFVVFPRIPPLWALPQITDKAVSGVTDNLTMGKFTQLTRSSELAFRVAFEGEVPAKKDRYWRGLVLADFDGDTWSQSSGGLPLRDLIYWQGAKPDWITDIESYDKTQYSYEVILEATQQQWLFSLDVPVSNTAGVGIAKDFRLLKNDSVRQRTSYHVRSYPLATMDLELQPRTKAQNLRLPRKGNDRSKVLAQRWRSEFDTDAEYIDKVLSWFRNEEFVYTLSPPPLTGSRIDQFLFDTRRGYCSHYASSFVYLMRAAGIPARMVVGYQGGELNPLGQHMSVYQYDAHAWAEVWQSGRGWYRVDPTAAVSLLRIETGAEASLSADSAFLSDTLLNVRRLKMPILDRLLNQYDLLNYQWSKWVLGYDQKKQFEFFSQWIGDYGPATIARVLTIAVLVIGLPIAWILFRSQRTQSLSVLQKIWFRFCKKAEFLGDARMRHEGPLDYQQRLLGLTLPARQKKQIQEIVSLYLKMAYEQNQVSSQELGLLKAKVRSFTGS